MKAFYAIWPDEKYIDQLIDAGIDTLLLAWYDIPKDPPSGYYDPYDRLVGIARRYNQRVKVLAVVNWARQWTTVPEGHQLLYQGIYRKRTPCIKSVEYMDSRVRPALDLVRQGIVHSVIWDLEAYEHNNSDVLKIFEEKIACECPRCAGVSWETQWEDHQIMLKERLGPINPINGHLPIRRDWALKRYPTTPILFTEDTYEDYGQEVKKEKCKWWWNMLTDRRRGVKYTVHPGFYIEMIPPDKYISSLAYASKQSVFGHGYWIYSEWWFSRYSKAAQTTRKIDDVNPNFFRDLKALNG